MANENVVDIFTRFGILALVILGLMSFAIIIQSDNSAPQPISSDPNYSHTFSSLNSSLSDLEGTSQSQWNSFKSENPIAGFASIVMFSIVNIGKTFGSLTFSAFSIIIALPVLVLGIPATATSLLLSWLTIAFVVALWILYKLGG